MTAAAIQTPVDPPPYDLIEEVDLAGLKVAVVRAALELDVFTTVANGATSTEQLATQLACSHRGIRTLVRALLSLGLLEGDATALRCSATAATYLARGGRGYAAPIYLTWLRNRDRLVDAIRSGRSQVDHAASDAADDWTAYAAPDLVRWPVRADQLVERLTGPLGVKLPAAAQILDLGCGSGLVGFALARRFTDAEVVSVDRQAILPIARELARDMGVERRVTFVAGDVQSVHAPADRFDVVLFLNVAQYLHDAALADVLCTARAALRAGGQLVMATPIVDEGTPGNAVNFGSAIEMYLASSVEQRGEHEVLNLLRSAGFDEVTRPAPHLFISTV